MLNLRQSHILSEPSHLKRPHGELAEAAENRLSKVQAETIAPPTFGKENHAAWADVFLWKRRFFCTRSLVAQYRAAVLTVSDKGALGLRQDTSGPAIVQALEAMHIEVFATALVADERPQISAQLKTWALGDKLDLVITTGGTGPAPRDWTPEATRDVIEREMPGLAELLRAEGAMKTPLAVLSRGIAGLCGRCLIINLPGSPRAVREGMDTLAPVLPHCLQMARGLDTEHR